MIPPWCVQRMTEVFCEEQGEGATGTFRTLGVSGALNAAVAVAAETANAPPAARGRGGSAAKPTGGESVSQSEQDSRPGYEYLTAAELRRVGAKMSVGGRGLERVERSGGQYYLQSARDYD